MQDLPGIYSIVCLHTVLDDESSGPRETTGGAASPTEELAGDGCLTHMRKRCLAQARKHTLLCTHKELASPQHPTSAARAAGWPHLVWNRREVQGKD